MRIFIKSIVYSFMLYPLIALAGMSPTQDYMSVFESWCLQNSDDFSYIDRKAKSQDLMPLSKKYLQGMKSIVLRGGAAYFMKRDGARYIIAYSRKGACRVTTDKMNIESVKKLILQYYKVSHALSDSEGMAIKEVYEFSKESKYSGGLIIFIYYKSEPKYGVTAIVYVPSRSRNAP